MAASAPCCFRLEATRGPHADAVYRYCWQDESESPSPAPALSIGRKKRCWLRLPEDLEVSSAHAELRRVEAADGGTGLAIRDTKSTNGSKLNGKPLKPQQDYPLNNGDLIGVGRTSLRFVQVVHGQPCGEEDASVSRDPTVTAAILTPSASPAAPPVVIVLDDESAEEREPSAPSGSASASKEGVSSSISSGDTSAGQPDTEPAHDELVLKLVMNVAKSKRGKEKGDEVDSSLAQKSALPATESGSRTGCVNEYTPGEATCTVCSVVIGQLDLLEQQAHLNECLGGRVATKTATNAAISAAAATTTAAAKPKTRKRGNAGNGTTRAKKTKAGKDGDNAAATALKTKKPRKRKRVDAGKDIELALVMAGTSKMDKEQETDVKITVARKKLEQLDVQMAKLANRRANLVKTLDRLERAKEKLRKSQVLPPAKVREFLDLKAALDAIFSTNRQVNTTCQRESRHEEHANSVVAKRYAPSRWSESGNAMDCDEAKRAELEAVAAISMWTRASQQLFGLERDTLLYRNSVMRAFLGDADDADRSSMDQLLDNADDDEDADFDREGESEAEGDLVPMPPSVGADQPEVPDLVKRVFPNWQRDLAFLQEQTAEELETALEAMGEAQAAADAEAANGAELDQREGCRTELSEECSAGVKGLPREAQRLACSYMAQVMKEFITEKRQRAGIAETAECQPHTVIESVGSSGEYIKQSDQEAIVDASDNEAEEEPYTAAPEEQPKEFVGWGLTAVSMQPATIGAEPEQSIVQHREPHDVEAVTASTSLDDSGQNM